MKLHTVELHRTFIRAAKMILAGWEKWLTDSQAH